MADGLNKKFNGFSWRGITAALGLAVSMAVAAPHDAAAADLVITDSRTLHTRQMDAMTLRFNQENPDVKVIIVSRDWFQINAALNNASTVDHTMMTRLAERYVQEKAGIKLPARYYREISLLARDESNNSLTIDLKSGEREQPKSVCFVFPPSPDKSAESHLRAKTLNIFPGIHEEFSKRPLNPAIRAALHQRYGTYHELGHCYDDRFVKKALDMEADGKTISLPDYILLRHKMEIFSEVFPALLLVREGITDIAAERAEIRLSGEALGGPVSYRLPRSFSDTGGEYSGYIYTVHKALRAVQNYINAHAKDIERMKIDEIIDLSARIADENAFGEEGILGTLFLWQSLYDTDKLNEMTEWRLAARKDGKLDYQRAHEFALTLRREMNESLRRVFMPDNDNNDREPIDSLSFNFKGSAIAYAEENASVAGIDDVETIKKNLLDKAVVSNRADPDFMIRMYEQYQHNLRLDATDGTAETKNAALQKLSVSGEALRQILRTMKWEKEAHEMERHYREFQEKQKTAPGIQPRGL